MHKIESFAQSRLCYLIRGIMAILGANKGITSRKKQQSNSRTFSTMQKTKSFASASTISKFFAIFGDVQQSFCRSKSSFG